VKAVGVFAIKGGVGKTLISINLAYRLREYGRVGLIDADFDNSNFAQFTQFDEAIEVTKDQKLVLPEWNGVKVFSASLLVGRERSVSMTADRYVQMLSDAMEFGDWGRLDYVVIDLPAGSSDVWKGVLSIFANVLLGDLIVTQPCMTDATVKALNVHRYFDIPVVGVVDNMAYFKCSCGQEHYVFGDPDATKKATASFGYEYLGAIPIVPDMPKRLAEGNPIIESKVIDDVAKKISEMEVKSTSFLERIKEGALKAIKHEVEKVLAWFIVRLQKEFDASKIAEETGFTEERPFLLTITDEEGRKVITSVPLRLRKGKLVVLKNPERIDYEIATSFRTLARCVMGKARIRGKVVDFDAWDAWANGDIKVYGTGFTPRAVKVLREVFGDEDFMNELRERYGKVLEKWI